MRRYWRPLLALVMLFAMMAAIAIVTDHPGQAVHATSGDWPTYLGGNARTGYNSAEVAITATTAKSLKLNWTFPTGAEISTQPVVANGQVYWGSWNGNEYATDLSGKKIWTVSIGGQTPNCSNSQTFGVGSSAAVADVAINGQNTTVVFVGGKDAISHAASMYALNAATGATIWEKTLSSSTASFSWSSPAVCHGSVYMGLASYDDCPLVQGALIQLDATTGNIQHTFYTVPGTCLGDSIWSTPTIDEAAGTIYVTTGNNGSCSTTEIYAQAIVKLNASDLSVIDSWQVPASQHGVDSDFGATPTLFTATYGGSLHGMVGAVNKNGFYYAFDRSSLSSGPVWSVQISTSTISISSSAWDGAQLYVAGRTTSIGGKSCKGSIQALDPASGHSIWQDCFQNGGVLAPVSAVPGVVFVGEGSHLLAIDVTSGNILFNYTTSGAVNAAPSISNAVVYAGNASGTLYTFGLPPTLTPTPTNTLTPSPSPGTILDQDTFQRPNQALWGTASDGQTWAGNANTLPNFSINNNTGVVSGTKTGSYSAILGSKTTDAEVLFSGSISAFNGTNLAALLHFTDNNNYYKALIDGSNLVIVKKVNGTVTRLASHSFSATANQSYTVRFNVTGSTLSAKVWQTGTLEPGNWMVSTTDSSFASGYCGLLLYLQNGVVANISSFLVTS
jgi:outer membrane protein assembly factor BamB